MPDASPTTAPADPPAGREHLPALDGVRGVAVLMVVVYHSTHLASADGPLEVAFDTLRGMFWCGVDLFFVLSGFLITRILLATRDSPRYFRSFYLRRTVRIFPLYYGLLLALFVLLPLVAAIAGGPLASVLAKVTETAEYEQLAGNQLWLWAYLQNLLQAEGPSKLPGLGHFWSLAVEEQFYLVWPALVWLVTRGGNREARVAGLSLLLIVATPVLRAALLSGGADPWTIFHWTFTRCDALAWGALAAAFAADATARDRVARWARGLLIACIAGWLAVGAAAGGWSKLSPPVLLFGYTFAAAGFAAWVFRLAKTESAGWLTTPWLRTLGKVSYAMYVFHWPLCRGAERLLAETAMPVLANRLLQMAIVLSASFALAWCSWHVWEKHWLRLKRFAPY